MGRIDRKDAGRLSEIPGLIVAPKLDMLARATSEDGMAPRIEENLQTLLGKHVSVSKLQIPRVFPRRDGSWIIQYKVDLVSTQSERDLSLVLCGRLNAASGAVTPWPLAGPHFRIPDIHLDVPLFPYDPGLPAIADFWTPLISGHYNGDKKFAVPADQDELHRPRVLSYKLERRCTLLSDTGNGAVKPGYLNSEQRIIKLLHPRGLKKTLKAFAYLKWHNLGNDPDEEYGLATLESADPEKGILVFERAPGKSLHDMMGTDTFVSGCCMAGLILHRLHLVPGDTLTQMNSEITMAAIKKQTRTHSAFLPELEERLRKLIGAMDASGQALSRKFSPVALHGDYYDKQILVEGNRATLLDLETLSGGDPGLDVGNFIAHLELRGLQHSESADWLRQAQVEFMESYGNSNRDFIQRVQWWKAASLTRLAMVYSLRPRWRHLVCPLLDLADAAREQ